MGISYSFPAPYGLNNSNAISPEINYLKQNHLNYLNYLNYLNNDYFLTCVKQKQSKSLIGSSSNNLIENCLTRLQPVFFQAKHPFLVSSFVKTFYVKGIV